MKISAGRICFRAIKANKKRIKLMENTDVFPMSDKN